MKTILAASAFAVIAMCGVSGANANPAGVLAGIKNGGSAVEQTGWHRHKKCWWSHGHRHCRWW
jgi:hypothetical protein